MGNLEQRCSKDGNGSGSFISIVLARSQKIPKTTDNVPFQFLLEYMQRESVKRIMDPLIIVTGFYEICCRKFIGCRCRKFRERFRKRKWKNSSSFQRRWWRL